MDHSSNSVTNHCPKRKKKDKIEKRIIVQTLLKINSCIQNVFEWAICRIYLNGVLISIGNMTNFLWDDEFRFPPYFMYTSLYAPTRCAGMNVPQHTYRCTQNTKTKPNTWIHSCSAPKKYQKHTYDHTHKVDQKNTHYVPEKDTHWVPKKTHTQTLSKTRIPPPSIPHTHRHPPFYTL